MNTSHALTFLLTLTLVLFTGQSVRGSVSLLEAEVNALLNQQADRSADLTLLLRLSGLCLDLGDELADVAKRREAYEAGARTAKQALKLAEGDAQAHYLYAANLGSAAQVKGLVAGAVTVREIKHHVRRALELRHDHAPSLHMMGMLLEELPWVLGGDPKAALEYLAAAVSVDPGYLHARLDLAKAYLKRNDPTLARPHLQIIVEGEHGPLEGRTRRYVEEARKLLGGLNERARR